MSETSEELPNPGDSGDPVGPTKGSSRAYIIVAAILVVVIVVTGAYLAKVLLSDGDAKPEVQAEVSPTLAATFTPGPTKEPTNTPAPPPSATPAPFVMTDDYTAVYGLASAGARPSTEWTGFFGQVSDVDGEPVADVPLIVLYTDGTPVELEGVPTSPIVKTDAQGGYEIRLANAPLAGVWSLVVLTEEGHPASDFMTFETDQNSDSGIQQIQVLWQQKP